jgi:hypothetical protein
VAQKWFEPMGGSIGTNHQTKPRKITTTSPEGPTRGTNQAYNPADRVGNLGIAPDPMGAGGACSMTSAILALACFATGFIVAVLLREVSVAAQISRAQERMQRKVRYWMGEAAHARSVAEELIYQLAACTGRDPEPPDWLPPASR